MNAPDVGQLVRLSALSDQVAALEARVARSAPGDEACAEALATYARMLELQRGAA